jgi:hypothetical protein
MVVLNLPGSEGGQRGAPPIPCDAHPLYSPAEPSQPSQPSSPRRTGSPGAISSDGSMTVPGGQPSPTAAKPSHVSVPAGIAHLLDEARRVGLELRGDGDRIVIRGPRSGADLARQILTRKAEVLATLAGAPQDPAAVVDGDASPDGAREPWSRVSGEAPLASWMFDAGARPGSAPDPSRVLHACACCGWPTCWRRRPDGPWTCARCHPSLLPAASIETVTVGEAPRA